MIGCFKMCVWGRKEVDRRKKRVMIQQQKALGKKPDGLLMVVARDVVNHLVIGKEKENHDEIILLFLKMNLNNRILYIIDNVNDNISNSFRFTY